MVSLPQAAHEPEFRWLPQRNKRDDGTVRYGAANEFSGVDLMLLSGPYGHLDEADEHG